LLRLRRKPEEGIDLALGKQLQRLDHGSVPVIQRMSRAGSIPSWAAISVSNAGGAP
jgi:hypothetical protein